MSATHFARSARHIGDSAPSIHNKRKSLRRRSDPKPRRIVPIAEEIVVESHAGVGAVEGLGPLEESTRIGRSPRRRIRGGEVER